MNITQTFYDNLASQYDKLFQDWHAATGQQAALLDALFAARGFDRSARLLDCACGIGTQAIGLASLGYPVTASDFSAGALAEAQRRAEAAQVQIPFAQADFRALSQAFQERFDIVIAMDNALPHMLTHDDLAAAIASITAQVAENGIFVASIRDYDALLAQKPAHSAPYIHRTELGQRVSFQTWTWNGENYRLIQYLIDDEGTLGVSKFECEYRATRRSELTSLLLECGCRDVQWLFPEESSFYQPIVIARK
jgi:2-polyprenyl-3-methyl-5-hydroxy-6-metoxy-1,4-benzoquinol methylase